MSANDPLIGKQLGDYTIQSVLGQGGMARVYRGYDSKLDRYAAVKVIEPRLASGEDDEEYRERFLREARSIARLHHPRIVSVYQFGSVDTMYYMAMSFLEGRDLRQILKEYSRLDQVLSPQQVVTIIRDIADALDYAHRQGVIHRDVKPSNIMVTADGHAVLTDFGLAMNAQEGTIGNTFGSVHYIAPEQAVSSAAAVPQSDLYALGVVLFEIMTGRVPFEDVSAMTVALKHISDPPPVPSTINPKISLLVDQVILKAMDKEPARRYPTGVAFVQALEKALLTVDDDDTDKITDTAANRMGLLPAQPTQPEPILMPASSAVYTRSGEEQPTISDSASMRPGTLPFSPLTHETERIPQRRGGLLIGIIVVGLLVLLGAGLLILPSLLSDGSADQTATAVALASEAEANQTATVQAIINLENTALAAITNTATAAPTVTPTIPPSATATLEATLEATSEVTRVATREATLAETAVIVVDATEATAAAVTGTLTPTPTQTPLPTLTPTAAGTPPLVITVAAGEDLPEVVLRYNGSTLVLYNRSPAGQRIDISSLTFNGPRSRFAADEWPESELFRMGARDCYQVWTLEFNEPRLNDLPLEFPAEICESRRGAFATSRTFWISADEGATFEVRRFNRALGTCPTVTLSDTEGVYCEIDLPNDS